ncbi:isochorismate synthase 2 [Striga asiatica]|uniref:Isochorismate synthase 2 n=1 Tax=Striga asiatica TaxID=4170 RepID=A0A5A7PZT5_STRAF|nr:isochorismate synthase 2 [Striga asiatica]
METLAILTYRVGNCRESGSRTIGTNSQRSRRPFSYDDWSVTRSPLRPLVHVYGTCIFIQSMPTDAVIHSADVSTESGVLRSCHLTIKDNNNLGLFESILKVSYASDPRVSSTTYALPKVGSSIERLSCS